MHFDLDVRGMMLLANRGVLEQGDIRLVMVGKDRKPLEQNPLAFAARCRSNWRPCHDVAITQGQIEAFIETKRM